MIIKGTTLTHCFSLPINIEEVDSLSIVYKQHGMVILEKCEDDVEYDYDNNMIVLSLSSDDTASFHDFKHYHEDIVLIQLIVTDLSGNTYASQKIRERIENNLLLELESDFIKS